MAVKKKSVKPRRKPTGNPLYKEGGVIRVMAEGIMASQRRLSRTKISGEPYRHVAGLLLEYRSRGRLKSFNAKRALELAAMHMALGQYLLSNPGALTECPEGLEPYAPQVKRKRRDQA